ncbi:MAG TPA: XrtA/PEP-CTERM system exopolysaccharide export protein [Steroidobacteraceae bacterium]|nr:XrtA/PEP-CTERM system exopolysaccharide export protein [Steroidobacteraceae bacterium]
MQKISVSALACLLGLLAGAGAVIASAQTAASQPPPAQAMQSPDYIIGPGDEIEVFVWQNRDLSVTVPVRPDGKISTPLDEDMVAVGKTPSSLAHDIEIKLSEYVRSPHVSVIVVKPDSVFSQVKVIGQVAHPQAIAYRQGMTVLDAVLAVGGLTDYAAGNRARIVRMVNGQEQNISLRLNALVNGGDMSQNLALKPGDVLVVPESRF